MWLDLAATLSTEILATQRALSKGKIATASGIL